MHKHLMKLSRQAHMKRHVGLWAMHTIVFLYQNLAQEKPGLKPRRRKYE